LRGYASLTACRIGPRRYFAEFDEVLERRSVGAHAGTYVDGFNWGLTTFDTFPDAFITIFQVITLEGWAQIM